MTNPYSNSDPKKIREKKEKKKCQVYGCQSYAIKGVKLCKGHQKQWNNRYKKNGKVKSSKPKVVKKRSKAVTPRDKAKAAFQKYIRLRDADKNGIVTCITCQRQINWTGGSCHGGHYRPATHNNTCFDEKNVNGQCGMPCNKNRMQVQEWIEQTAKNIDKKWGEGTANNLITKSHLTKRFNRMEYMVIEKHYKEKFEQLSSERKAKGWVV